MCWWLETRAGAVASRASWLCWDFRSLKAWKLISQCQHGQLIFNNWPTWVRTFFFASFSSVRRVGLMCPTSFKIQLTFIYVCLCLHNINFHQMMWTTYREPVIDINLLRFLFFAFNSCKQRVKEKKDFKWFHDRVDLLTVFFSSSLCFSLALKDRLTDSSREETNYDKEHTTGIRLLHA